MPVVELNKQNLISLIDDFESIINEFLCGESTLRNMLEVNQALEIVHESFKKTVSFAFKKQKQKMEEFKDG